MPDDAQLSPSALEDIQNYLAYLKRVEAPESAARKFYESVRKMRALIGQQPDIGTGRPHWGAPPDLQALPGGGHLYVFTADVTPPLIVRLLGPGANPDAVFEQHHPSEFT